MTPKKEPITEVDICKLERAINLKLLSTFERNFVNNLKTRFEEYGLKMVITEDQSKILNDLSLRYYYAYEEGVK